MSCPRIRFTKTSQRLSKGSVRTTDSERERSEGDTEKEQRLGYLSPCLHPISASCRGRNGEALE